jgi:hypothetical protein
MNIFSKRNKKTTTKANISKSNGIQVFNVSLIQAVKNNPSFDGIPLPALVRECLDYIMFYGILFNIDFLLKKGLDLEGIFRVSSPKSRLDELESMANSERRDEIVFKVYFDKI